MSTAILTAPAPSMNGVTAAAAGTTEKSESQLQSLRIAAANKLAYGKTLFRRALAAAGNKARSLWAAATSVGSKALGFVKSHGVAVGAGSAAVMATRAGYKAVANAAVSATTWVAKAAVKVAEVATTVASKVVGAFGWLVSKFSKTAGEKINTWNTKAIAKRDRALDTARAYIDGTAQVARNVLTADSTSNVVNTTAAVTGGAVVINALTGGAVASMALELPSVGAYAASAIIGGPATLVVLLAGIGLGLINTLTRNKEVDKSISHNVADPTVIEGTVIESVDAPIEGATVEAADTVEAMQVMDAAAAVLANAEAEAQAIVPEGVSEVVLTPAEEMAQIEKTNDDAEALVAAAKVLTGAPAGGSKKKKH